jgi:hypothetical protein
MRKGAGLEEESITLTLTRKIIRKRRGPIDP